MSIMLLFRFIWSCSINVSRYPWAQRQRIILVCAAKICTTYILLVPVANHW